MPKFNFTPEEALLEAIAITVHYGSPAYANLKALGYDITPEDKPPTSWASTPEADEAARVAELKARVLALRHALERIMLRVEAGSAGDPGAFINLLHGIAAQAVVSVKQPHELTDHLRHLEALVQPSLNVHYLLHKGTPADRCNADGCVAAREAAVCRSGDDGKCSWFACPQLRDGEPEANRRSCPLVCDWSDEH